MRHILKGVAAIVLAFVSVSASAQKYQGGIVDKTVAVIGGGNSAAADALLLTRVAEKVILVHRRDTLRAEKYYHKPLAEAENVEFRLNSVVREILHDGKVTGVRLQNVETGAEETVSCAGVFVSVGRKPASEPFGGQLELDGDFAGHIQIAHLLGVQNLQHHDILIRKAAVINDVVLSLKGMTLILQCFCQNKHLRYCNQNVTYCINNVNCK